MNEILQVKESTQSIAHEEFEKWSKSTSLEDLEALSVLIFDKSFYEKIDPFLSVEDYQNVLLPYFKRCIIENHQNTVVDSRYEACRGFLNWFNQLWKDESGYHDQLLEIKRCLSDLYRCGDEKIKVAIVNGVLEHLFEDEKTRAFFNDWKKTPVLQKAYKEACMFFDLSK